MVYEHFIVPTLYSMSLNTFVRWEHFQLELLNDLPGFVKDDVMRLSRGKCNKNISAFLHSNVRKLDICEYEISVQDLENISHCFRIRVLEMNPKKYQKFNHPSWALEMLVSRLHSLVKLHMQRNDGVTDNVVEQLATHCSVLQELDVAGCTNLTDNSASSLSTLTYLQAVNFSDTEIGDHGLIALGTGLSSKSLRELKLNNCKNVSDNGINALVKDCKSISVLVFCGCPKVSVDCQLALDSFLGKDIKPKLVTWTVYL